MSRRARSLCQVLVDRIATSNLGSMTTTIYDTAWLSMVFKQEDGHVRWLFPECWHYILSHQLPSGGWEAYSTTEDGVLNSLAALLALKRHQSGTDSSIGLDDAITNATMFIENSLRTMEVDGILPIGYEILVPAHLAMLESIRYTYILPGNGLSSCSL